MPLHVGHFSSSQRCGHTHTHKACLDDSTMLQTSFFIASRHWEPQRYIQKHSSVLQYARDNMRLRQASTNEALQLSRPAR